MRPTCLAHSPPALTTCSAWMTPFSVTTFQVPSARGSRASTLLCSMTSAPRLRAAPAYAWTVPVGVEVALAVRPQSADDPGDVDDGALLADLVRGHEVAVLDPDGLEYPVRRLKPLPALGHRGDGDPAGHVQPDVLAGLLLDLRQQIDGVRLQRGHVRVRVERVHAARRVPRRARREHRAFHQRHVGPAELGEVVEHRRADHAAADDDDPVVGLGMGIHDCLLGFMFAGSGGRRRGMVGRFRTPGTGILRRGIRREQRGTCSVPHCANPAAVASRLLAPIATTSRHQSVRSASKACPTTCFRQSDSLRKYTPSSFQAPAERLPSSISAGGVADRT